MLGRGMGASSGLDMAASRLGMAASAASGRGCLRRQEVAIDVKIRTANVGWQPCPREPSLHVVKAITPARQLELSVVVSLQALAAGIALKTLACVHLSVSQCSLSSCQVWGTVETVGLQAGKLHQQKNLCSSATAPTPACLKQATV